MDIQAVEFENEMKKLTSPRRPLDIVNVGDSVLRAVICEGEGKWYIHDYDEFFLQYKGDVVVESDNSRCELEPGTGVLVPAGVRHRTNSQEPAVFMVFRNKQTACILA
jgi:mannose-6-phosphate isomerase-like protein (cupin superfamily)